MTTAVTRYTANASRQGKLWYIGIPDAAGGLATQAKSIGDIAHMARSCIATMLEVEYESVDVDVNLTLPAVWETEARAVADAHAEVDRARAAARRRARAAARRLHRDGLTYKDIGALLGGVSMQRIGQLINGTDRAAAADA